VDKENGKLNRLMEWNVGENLMMDSNGHDKIDVLIDPAN
jgi:hypothetical protein